MTRVRNIMSKKMRELLDSIPDETKERIRKAFTCAHFCNGGDCNSGGKITSCNPDGCVAWKQHPEIKG